MSFKENTYQQMSFTDSFSGLTAREQKALEKSWAKVFADEIFPAIDEKRFSVLYSDQYSDTMRILCWIFEFSTHCTQQVLKNSL